MLQYQKRGFGKRIVNISGRTARYLHILDNSETKQRFQTVIFVIQNINLLRRFVDLIRTVNAHFCSNLFSVDGYARTNTFTLEALGAANFHNERFQKTGY